MPLSGALAELLRELAVLVLVFIPLDLWRGQMSGARSAAILFGCGGFFALGCEGAFLAIGRGGGKMTQTQTIFFLLLVAAVIAALVIGAAFAALARVRAKQRSTRGSRISPGVPTSAEFYRELMRH